ncbi:hypothetical protein Phi46:3_gp069 [Cellulophaga phage phi46:3]|uniref:Uncharacterized protein n=1 Tax=Cellulophaga phage phi46:3 TaxID=1327985 RepID=S0A3L4_9CAUD|nr:hypothetical protein Phi46:3_gp069 [Cellulophaga phage phi46:3]AGO48813.1 hypothetical protein Phi46:3_gp069 [Cellulophaga phage phi46:3]
MNCTYCDKPIPPDQERYLGESELAFCEECFKIIN